MVLSIFFGHWKKELIQKIHTVQLSLHSSMASSFHHVGKDLASITEWIQHLHMRDTAHEKRLLLLESRLASMESYLSQQNLKKHSSSVLQSSVSLPEKEDAKVWDTLTDTQQQICWKLASLQKETPDKWISQKYLAQEIYPERDYNQVRSALSQYISVLEDLGIVVRKRKGKHAFVLSTENNPCLKQKQSLELQQWENPSTQLKKKA